MKTFLRALWDNDVGIRVRLRPDPYFMLWSLRFLAQCTTARCRANSKVKLRLALYSRDCINALTEETAIGYDERRKGILYFFRSKESFARGTGTYRFLADHGLPAHVAVTALALIGLFNIVGTYTTGWLGGKMPKRYILSFIYFGRAVVIALFVFLPLSAASVYAFAIALGLLWLSTVPPTNGIVAQIFGVRYLAMLSGFTFFSHQIGSFLGAWLGGVLYDTTGSYDLVWYLSIALGVIAGLINLPIDEREIARPAVAAA